VERPEATRARPRAEDQPTPGSFGRDSGYRFPSPDGLAHRRIHVRYCDGNIYKPESRIESFAPRDFEKKNNPGEPDWSDARAAIDALNSPLRVTNPPAWRAGLEASFDVDHFLRWLAASNVLVNKDSYGGQAHNYYLYRHSRRGLVWIPWDHNLALRGSPGVASEGRRRSNDGLSLRMDEVGDGRTDALVEMYAAMISPWVVGPGGDVVRWTARARRVSTQARLGCA
jgi:hypothetical protein